jgi:hypothetical protein
LSAPTRRSALDEKQLLFIIGSPRSGTTLLQVLLASHPQVASTVELTLFDQYLAPFVKAWEREKAVMREYGFRRGLPAVWDEAELEQFLRDFLERAYRGVLERFPECTRLLDKNPVYSLHVHLIKRMLPTARFLHIIRDGRDVAASLKAATGLGFRLETFAAAGVMWRDHVNAAREAAVYGADYLEVRYEDLVRDPMPRYQEILAFCGLNAEPGWIARTIEENTFEKMKSRRATGDPLVPATDAHYQQGRAGRWREEFTARDRYELDQVAGPLLAALGYAQPGWWAESAAEKRTLPALGEIRRRGRLLGLILTLARRTLSGSRLPKGFDDFER